MSQPQDFHTMLQQQLDHMETKTRLTQAEKLLRTCDTVIKSLSMRLAARTDERDRAMDHGANLAEKLDRVPRWIRRIFNAY